MQTWRKTEIIYETRKMCFQVTYLQALPHFHRLPEDHQTELLGAHRPFETHLLRAMGKCGWCLRYTDAVVRL